MAVGVLLLVISVPLLRAAGEMDSGAGGLLVRVLAVTLGVIGVNALVDRGLAWRRDRRLATADERQV